MNTSQEKDFKVNKLVDAIRSMPEFQAISSDFKRMIFDLRNQNDLISQSSKVADLTKLALEKENKVLSDKLAKLLSTLKNIESAGL